MVDRKDRVLRSAQMRRAIRAHFEWFLLQPRAWMLLPSLQFVVLLFDGCRLWGAWRLAARARRRWRPATQM